MRGAPAAAARVAEADFDGLCLYGTTPLEGLKNFIIIVESLEFGTNEVFLGDDDKTLRLSM